MYKKLLQGVVLLGICTLSTICAAGEAQKDQKEKAQTNNIQITRYETDACIEYIRIKYTPRGPRVTEVIYFKHNDTYYCSVTEANGLLSTVPFAPSEYLAIAHQYEFQEKAKKEKSKSS